MKAKMMTLAAGLAALLLTGGQATATDCGRWNTPYFFRGASTEDVQTCLNAGADPNARSKNGVTPLHSAASGNENPAVIQALIDAGADLEARNEGGITPLHGAAAVNENPAVIEALLDAGADLEARTEGGWTPLHGAAFYNEYPAVIRV